MPRQTPSPVPGEHPCCRRHSVLVEKSAHDVAVPLHAPAAQPAAEAHCDADSTPQAADVPTHASAPLAPDFPALSTQPPAAPAATSTKSVHLIDVAFPR